MVRGLADPEEAELANGNLAAQLRMILAAKGVLAIARLMILRHGYGNHIEIFAEGFANVGKINAGAPALFKYAGTVGGHGAHTPPVHTQHTRGEERLETTRLRLV